MIFAAAVVLAQAAPAAQHGPNFIANSLADTDDGSCDDPGQGSGNHDCTLREAINAANAYGNGAVVGFSVSGTITLGSGLPNITNNCRIDGAGQKVTISGNNSVGIFQLNTALTSYSYGAYAVAFNDLTLANSSGSAMSVQGTSAVITNCLFANNSSSYGAAIHVGLSSTTTIANCTFFNNSANVGGAIYADAQVTTNHFFDPIYIYSSTFYNNHASATTGQYNLAAADIYSVGATAAELRNTILVNTDNRGTNQEDNAQGITYAEPSVFCNIDIGSAGLNNSQATAAQINLDTTPKDNGGSTQTVALLPGSVAINAGNNSAATGAPVNNQDQRGYVRVRTGDATCDSGAYEYGANGSLVVTTASDLTSASGGQNSLRTALTYAQSLTGPQTITFAPTLAGQTLTLSNAWSNSDSYNATSALRVDGNVTVQGLASAPGITLKVADGVPLRHFLVGGTGTMNLQNLTLTGGKPALSNFGFGGAVWNFGTLAVRTCTFTGNTAGSEGGAIQSWGDSTSLLIENSTLTGNQAGTRGGAIVTGAVSATLHYVTISNNTSPDGSAFVVFKYPVTMIDGLIGGSGNEGVIPDSGGTFSGSSTNNIFTSATAPGLTNGTNGNRTGITAAQLKLSALASNGGPTQTMALQAGSVAVDAGVTIAGLTTDQVGTSRPQSYLPDVGAFELIPTMTPGIYVDTTGGGGNGVGWMIGYPGSIPPSVLLFRNLNNPSGITFDAAGNLYYGSYDSGSRYTTIYKLAPGSNSPVPLASFFGRVTTSIVLNAAENSLYAVMKGDFYNLTSYAVINPSGGGSVAYYNLNDPQAGAAAMDSADNLYVAESDQSIRVFPAAGGGPNVFVSGVVARGLAFDAHGNLYASVADNAGNGSILKYTPAGAQSSFASGLTNFPTDLAFDTNGNLFVAEAAAANQTGAIIKIAPDGTKSTFDSNVGQAFAGGGGGPQYIGIFPRLRPALAPSINPLGGTYPDNVPVSITSSNAGTTIRYTLDGSAPSATNGQIYSGPITLTRNATVKAIAYGSGWIDSTVTSVAYTVLPSLAYWRNLQGLPADGSQDLANPSGDGIANLLKYAFNLAPNAGDLVNPNYRVLVPNGTAGLPLITYDGQGHLVITFVRRKAASNADIAYVVETGPDLANWNPLDLTNAAVNSIDVTWERVTVTDPTVATRRFGRVRVLEVTPYFNDFNAGLGAATLYGSATWVNQAVQLTDTVAGQGGAVIFNGITLGSYNSGFIARFNLQLGPTTSGLPADGVSFAVGALPAAPWGEVGPGGSHSLAIGFDTYDNGGDGAIGIHLWLNGVHIASNPTNPYTNGVLVPVEISYDTSNGVTVKFNGTTVLSNVPISSFNFLSTDTFGVGGRTGGANERAIVDDVQITPR